MKKLYNLLILLILGIVSMHAQSGIYGIIKDEDSGEVLVGAAIYNDSLQIGTVTDFNGYYIRGKSFYVPNQKGGLIMNRFAAGLIAGSIVTALGVGMIIFDKDTKDKITSKGRKAVRRAEDAMDSFTENYLK